MTSSSHLITHVLVTSPSNQTMHFPILLQGKNQIVETTALIDSDATGNFMDILYDYSLSMTSPSFIYQNWLLPTM